MNVIEILKNALNSVENRYYTRNERDFSYELYYQLRSNDFPLNIEVSCETRKQKFSFEDNIFDDPLIRKYFFGSNNNPNRDIWRFPDLLIHEYNSKKHQQLAVEIKKARNINNTVILKDLSKLIVYCRGRLNYKHGILIVVGAINTIPNEKIREFLLKYSELEIWIVSPKNIQIINASTLIQL